jgi:hypothetical protein
MSFPLIHIYITVLIMISLFSIFMPILNLTQANHQTAVACGAAFPSPEEKNEIEKEKEYEKTHEVILVLVLRPPLTLPGKNGEGSCGDTAARYTLHL